MSETLSSREVDVEIALQRGWRYCTHPAFGPSTVRLVDPAINMSGAWREVVDYQGGRKELAGNAPNYTTDIAEAWPLLEEMRGSGPVNLAGGVVWLCTLGLDGELYAYADNAATAICQAWLEWKTGRRVTVEAGE